MTTKSELYHLVDELDEDTAREALTLLQDLLLPRNSARRPGRPGTRV
jgi:hypothetical protein